jgi:uncharacterized protein (TIGR03083 family)
MDAMIRHMHHTEHIGFLTEEGERLAVAAEAAGMGAKVPSCPRWKVVDLVGHVGMIHRWATQFVADGITGHRPPPPDAMERPEEPDALMSWYRTGHRSLVDSLLAAPEDLRCWYFLDAPSPLAFWARRQAHETAIHRADAELASGPITPHSPDLAADGIDEMLGGFVSGRRAGRLRPAAWAWRPPTAEGAGCSTSAPRAASSSAPPVPPTAR